MQQKEELIEDFKSKNAIVKNSLSYFPIAVTNLSEKAATDSKNYELVTRLNNLLKDILIYNLFTNEELTPKINQQIETLLKSRNQFAPTEKLWLGCCDHPCQNHLAV